MNTVKFRYKIARLMLVITVCCIICCHQSSLQKTRKIERAFYYWKSVLDITEYEKKALANLHVATMYLKFFDVDWDNDSHQALPIVQVRLKDAEILHRYLKEIIPVVFITNACIRNIDSLQAEELGIKISTLVNSICNENHLSFSELQIDCDWTAISKENYFTLLRSVKKHQGNNKDLSSTIRLYQIKYRSKTGIPPVDRGLLMAYNMGNLKDPSSNNSILESKELKKYVSNLSSYPLPLDVALPIFEWKVLFRNNIYSGLLENLADTFLNNIAIQKKSGDRFQLLKDTVLNGYSFIKGDLLRKEESRYEEILSAENILSKYLSSTSIRLSLFHLDSLILKKYTSDEMENIFNGLH